MTEASLCLLASYWQNQIKNSLWLGKHSQTSARPKAPRLLIPLKQQRERTGTVKRQDRKSQKVKSKVLTCPFRIQEKPKRRPCYH